ncbi:MAG: hypothetical protein J6A89_08655 [Clostridia bacterium]|nr:hypothetical protein [Clostridia bacterium]
MELFRNIFFNTDKVIENTDVKVTYAGKLFQEGAENVTVHYGFGENWEDSQDVQMKKTELGFQTDIYVKPNTKLNFCFRDSSGAWDNNNGTNYAFKIEKENTYQGCPINGINTNSKTYKVSETTTNGINYAKTQSVVNGTTYGETSYGTTQNSTETTNNVAETTEITALCNVTPTWGFLIKKTFNNFVNYCSKLFSKVTENVKDNNK